MTSGRRAAAALCLVQVVDVLGVTLLIAALPQMLRGLHAPPAMAGVLATAYAMTFGGLLMLGARLGDLIGHRRALLAGLLGFAGASALAGGAPSLAVLVAARALQGAAAAASVPAALRVLTELAPGDGARRRALAAWSAAGAAAGASGLLAGGLLTSLVGWRTVFWLNVPLAAMLMLAIAGTVPRARAGARTGLDVPGGLLLTGALMALILATSLLERAGSRMLGALCGAAGCILLLLFVRVERAAANPLLPRTAVQEPRLRIGGAAAFINTATTSSAVTLATLYLQDVRGASPAAAALRLLPFSLCVVLGAGMAGGLLQRRDPALGVAAGLGLIAVGDGALLLPGLDALLPLGAGVSGLGIGLSSVAANTLGTDVRSEHRGIAAGILNTAAQLGTALGVSATVLLAGITQHAGLPLRGTALSWAAAALVAAGAAVLVLRLRRSHSRPITARRETRG